ncbi:MAG: alpha/beta fold hydrolase [Candidatus Omnitrophica bacterium]|nr:alpha/beta fold hydrolase [Candidatus Omnitrophota bacterium]
MKNFIFKTISLCAAAPLVISHMLTTPDRHTIAYTYYPAGHEKVVIIAHGFYNSKDAVVLQQLAKHFLPEYDVFMFDFRGHGQSSGLFTWTSEEGQDLNAVFDFVEARYKKIGIIAFSIGGSVAINELSKRQRADSLVCVSAPSVMSRIDYQWWALDWDQDFIYTMLTKEGRKGKGVRPGPFWLAKEKPITSVEKLTVPVLYIHGDRDWVIRPWHSQALYNKTKTIKKIVFIEKGLHAEYLIRGFPEQFYREVDQWFHKTL